MENLVELTGLDGVKFKVNPDNITSYGSSNVKDAERCYITLKASSERVYHKEDIADVYKLTTGREWR